MLKGTKVQKQYLQYLKSIENIEQKKLYKNLEFNSYLNCKAFAVVESQFTFFEKVFLFIFGKDGSVGKYLYSKLEEPVLHIFTDVRENCLSFFKNWKRSGNSRDLLNDASGCLFRDCKLLKVQKDKNCLFITASFNEAILIEKKESTAVLPEIHFYISKSKK